MQTILILGIAITSLALVGGWLGWQLLRQNGRMLLRLEELEKRLNELEFGEGEQPSGLAVGAEAPDFDLPDLGGERKSLAGFRGRPILLLFFNPRCGFCRDLMPKLKEKAESRKQKAENEVGGPIVLVLSTGDAEANRALFAEHSLAIPVLLQNDGEVATAYQAPGTPSGYLIDAEGKIAGDLAIGAEALLKLLEEKVEEQKTEIGQSQRGPVSGNEDGREHRFSSRSLAHSKIRRDGLKAGTPAPDFRLPRLDGEGDLSLSELRGKPVLLVFSSPGCGPCDALAPELEKFHREQMGHEVGRGTPREDGFSRNGAPRTARPTLGITVVMISKGEPAENRAKAKKHGLTFLIVLQQQWEISRLYALFATPIAYLIDEQGVITHDVAVGVEPILALMGVTVR